MTPEEANTLRREVANLKQIVNFFVRTTDYEFKRPIKGGTDGLRINTMASEKLGFFDKLPVAQFSDGLGRQDVGTNTGAAANVGFTVNGNTGSEYYSLGDVVYALKQYGLLDS